MQLQETKQEITLQEMLDKERKKSLASLMIYLYDRWEEEKTYELFLPYQIYLKNVLRKYTPKRTKFVCLTQEPFCLTLNLHGVEYKITVINREIKINLD